MERPDRTEGGVLFKSQVGSRAGEPWFYRQTPMNNTTTALTARPAVRRLAPVRLIALFALLLAGDIGAQLARIWAFKHATPTSRDWVGLGVSLVLGAMLVALYIALVWGFERRKAREISPSGLQALAGVAVGLALFATVFAILGAAGVARWGDVSSHFDVIPVLAASIVAAIGEELAFRGGVFRVLEDSLGTFWALICSAAVFGLLHALNPGATVLSTLAIALEAGILLGAAYALTRNLWFAIGLHLGWNFTEGGVFGVSVSGFSTGKGIFTVALSGPTLLTGGKFGPEASIVAIAVCLAAALVLLALAVRRGLWRPASARFVLD